MTEGIDRPGPGSRQGRKVDQEKPITLGINIKVERNSEDCSPFLNSLILLRFLSGVGNGGVSG
jgi:hypothetical protein